MLPKPVFGAPEGLAVEYEPPAVDEVGAAEGATEAEVVGFAVGFVSVEAEPDAEPELEAEPEAGAGVTSASAAEAGARASNAPAAAAASTREVVVMGATPCAGPRTRERGVGPSVEPNPQVTVKITFVTFGRQARLYPRRDMLRPQL